MLRARAWRGGGLRHTERGSVLALARVSVWSGIGLSIRCAQGTFLPILYLHDPDEICTPRGLDLCARQQCNAKSL
ncbi:hypothetical protein BDW66DRAFT_129159 [Aspergillus desertorum]